MREESRRNRAKEAHEAFAQGRAAAHDFESTVESRNKPTVSDGLGFSHFPASAASNIASSSFTVFAFFSARTKCPDPSNFFARY